MSIVKCTCKHAFQDERYGPGNRVMNPCRPAGGKDTAVRCTVCLKEKSIGVEKLTPKLATEKRRKDQ
jgi:hypothetical protein